MTERSFQQSANLKPQLEPSGVRSAFDLLKLPGTQISATLTFKRGKNNSME